MKQLTTTLFFLFLFGILAAQNLEVLIVQHQSAEAEAVRNEGIFQLNKLEVGKGKVKIKSASIVATDLVLDYRLPPLEFEEEKHQFSIELNGVHSSPEYLEIDTKKQQITWLNATEQVALAEGVVQLRLDADVLGAPFSCNEEPSFKLWKKPYPYITATGLVAVSVGYLFKGPSTNDYADYESAVFNPSTEPETRSANSYYNDANGKHQTYFILKYGGLGLAAASAIVGYLDYLIIYKKKKKRYDKYCREKSLSISPTYELIPSEQLSGAVGLGLNYTF